VSRPASSDRGENTHVAGNAFPEIRELWVVSFQTKSSRETVSPKHGPKSAALLNLIVPTRSNVQGSSIIGKNVHLRDGKKRN